MQVSAREHVGIQKRNLARVVLTGLAAGAFCFLAVWFLYPKASLGPTLLVAGVFASGIVVIGVISVLLTSAVEAKKIAEPDAEDKP